MQQININELKPHPRNNEFFDDMAGEKWKEFVESVRTSGVIEPIVITQDMTIVSGHQRVRACKELGIKSVLCEIKHYKDEDSIIKDLLETNVRQRGDVGGSAKKVGKRFKELDRLYGIEKGNNQHSSKPNNSVSSQADLAKMMGMSLDTYQNYKLLADMIPELEELLDTGIVTKTTALAMMKNLSNEEQEELISSLDTTKKITQKKVQEYIDEIRELKNNPPKPKDYEETKQQLNDYKKEYQSMRQQFEDKVAELQDLRKQMEAINDKSVATQYEKKLKDSSLLFCSKTATFIEQVGGYIWLTDKINELPNLEREGYIRAVHAIKSWADTMDYNINNKLKEII